MTSWSVSVAPARNVRLAWQYGERDGQSQAEGRNYGGKTFDPKIEASDKVSRIFQVPAEQGFAESEDPPRNPLQVTDNVQLGKMVPVRGFEPRSRG